MPYVAPTSETELRSAPANAGPTWTMGRCGSSASLRSSSTAARRSRSSTKRMVASTSSARAPPTRPAEPPTNRTRAEPLADDRLLEVLAGPGDEAGVDGLIEVEDLLGDASRRGDHD